jgi:hypothetical protein
MNEHDKTFHKIRKRLLKAKAHAAKGKAGAAERKQNYQHDLLVHVTKHGKPHGF